MLAWCDCQPKILEFQQSNFHNHACTTLISSSAVAQLFVPNTHALPSLGTTATERKPENSMDNTVEVKVLSWYPSASWHLAGWPQKCLPRPDLPKFVKTIISTYFPSSSPTVAWAMHHKADKASNTRCHLKMNCGTVPKGTFCFSLIHCSRRGCFQPGMTRSCFFKAGCSSS